MTKFVICNNPNNLEEFLQGKPSATVEAEYGDSCVFGSLLTLAHHGPRSANPAPCLAKNNPVAGVEVVGLSHLDLDSLGGCAAILGKKPDAPSFWHLAAFVDINGPHKISETHAESLDLRRFYAYWAWSGKNRIQPNRDGSVTEITKEVVEAIEVITAIIAGDQELLNAGINFLTGLETLNNESFFDEKEGVITRISGQFTNALYTTPDGKICEAVVALNIVTKAITISFANDNGLSAANIAKSLWGDLAGGHAGIAGSPRGQIMSTVDLMVARDEILAALLTKNNNP